MSKSESNVFNFSHGVIKDSLLDLDYAKLVHIDKKPLMMESTIYLQVGSHHIDLIEKERGMMIIED